MDEPVRTALREELGSSPPAFLDELDDRELRELTEVLSRARVRQAEEVEEAIDRAMRFLPWGVRGTVRRVLIG